MKKIFTLFVAVSSLSLASCVDDSFNLDDVNNDNVGVGDSNTVINVPVATIDLNFSDILSDFTRAVQTYTFEEQEIEDSIELGENWLDEEFKSKLTSGEGEISLTVECSEYPEGLPGATFEVWFDEIALFDGEQRLNSNNPKITTSSLGEQEIDDIAAANTLTYKVSFDEKSFECDLDELENITFSLSLTKTGAIKL
ncbi:MAG: hypothetical protein R3Y08_07930 [Rikenellaceae bacterium]